MPFQSIIAHRLYRPSPSAPVATTLANGCWPLTGKSEDCVRALKRSWLKRGGKVYGRFDDDIGSNPLPAWLKSWQEGTISFTKLTEHCLKQAETLLSNTESYLDVYGLFAHEVLESTEYLWLFLTAHEPAFAITNDLTLDDAFYLDTSRFVMAAKVNLSEFESGESNKYLTLVRLAGEKELSEWFEVVVGFTDKLDIAKQTEQLLGVVEDYARQLPEEQAEQTREKVVEYCLEQSKAGEAVSLGSLSKEVTPEDAPNFESFAAEHDTKPASEIVPHAGQLRQYVRLSGRSNVMSMSFSSGCLGEEVVYDAESDALIIKAIPPSLKTRLLKHLK